MTKKAAIMSLALVGVLIFAGSAFGESHIRGSQRTDVFQDELIGENGRGQVEATPIPLPKPRDQR